MLVVLWGVVFVEGDNSLQMIVEHVWSSLGFSCVLSFSDDASCETWGGATVSIFEERHPEAVTYFSDFKPGSISLSDLEVCTKAHSILQLGNALSVNIIYTCQKIVCKNIAFSVCSGLIICSLSVRSLCIAAMHFNENSDRLQAVTRDGRQVYTLRFPKYKKGGYIVCPQKSKPTQG